MKLNISVSSKFNPDRYVWYKLKKDIEVYQNELHKKDIVGLVIVMVATFLYEKQNLT